MMFVSNISSSLGSGSIRMMSTPGYFSCQWRHRLVQALVGQQLEGLVADLGEAHVGHAPHAAAEHGGDHLLEVVHVGHQRVDHDHELGAPLHRDVHVGGRADAAVDQLAALDLDRLVDHRQRGRRRPRRARSARRPSPRRRARCARRCPGRWPSGRARCRAGGSRWCGRGRPAPSRGTPGSPCCRRGPRAGPRPAARAMSISESRPSWLTKVRARPTSRSGISAALWANSR